MQTHQNHSRSEAGYNLITLSLFILVISLFLAAGLSLSRQYSWIGKQEVTAKNIQTVEAALQRYIDQNGSLPCPGNPADGIDTTNFGKASCTNSVAVTGRAGEAVRYGAVPTRTLGINDATMIDGWGHRLIYAVTHSYTTAAADFGQPNGAIRIIDAAGNNMTPEAEDRVIFAVLSAGADARGAYSMAGSQPIPCPSNAAALAHENCDADDATFRSSMLKQWNVNMTNTYTSSMKYEVANAEYEWWADDFPACNCGTLNENAQPIQTRTVQCRLKATGAVVGNALCAGMKEPIREQPCVTYCYRSSAPEFDCNSPSSLPENLRCIRTYGAVASTETEVTLAECNAFNNTTRVPQNISYTRPAACDTLTTCLTPPTPTGGSGGGNSSSSVTYYSYHGQSFTMDSNGNSWAGNTPYNSGITNPYGGAGYTPGQNGGGGYGLNNGGNQSGTLSCSTLGSC